MAAKKAKLSIAPLFTDNLHSDEMPYDLSPLTPEVDVPLATESLAPSGGFWQRLASEGFRLPTEPEEALHGPEYPVPGNPKQNKLSKGVKKLITKISDEIIKKWPPLPESNSNVLALVNSYAFVTQIFNRKLELEIHEDLNASIKETASCALRLHNLLENAASATTTRNQVLDLFLITVDNHHNIPNLIECLEGARRHASVIKRAKESGKKCRRQAVWIGLERVPEAEVEEISRKHLVETPEQVATGLANRAFTKDGYICLQNNTYRICAPRPSETDKMVSIIFWTKTSSMDTSPTWEKVFGGVVYNVEHLDTNFHQDNELVSSYMKATVNNVIAGSSDPLIRGGMTSEGVMTKAIGHTSTYGHSRDVRVAVPKITSKNPRQKTLNRVAELQQLRLEMHQVSPVMQAQNYAFLQGFLPSFAKSQMDTAVTASQARNILGAPNTSAFGTFAYCASSHTDDDESSTSGWVMKRANTIPRDQSNFVWCSHFLVVELAENTFWFWNAPKDKHGTTMNDLALKHPKSYKGYISAEPDRAQWTRVSVLTHAVMAADRRDEE